MAYDETTLRNEITNANDGDIIEITGDIHLSGTIDLAKVIIIRSSAGNHFIIFKNATGRHFNVSPNNIGGAITLENITLDGQETSGGVYINGNGHLIMDTASIVQNCYSGGANGGGIYAYVTGSGSGASITMKNGSAIRNCSSKYYGGGVYVGLNAVFSMEGGEISGCRSLNGGGIYISYSNLYPPTANITISGGSIRGCEAQFGGGILIVNTVRVASINAPITENVATTYGGGIAIIDGDFSNINISLVSGNRTMMSVGQDEQIYILDDHHDSKMYTVIGSKSSYVSLALLNGENHVLTFFKVYDNNTGEYLVALCGELGLGVIPNDYYVNYFLPNVNLNVEQMDKIAITIRVALRGIRSYDVVVGDAELSIRAYAAQYVIWNIVAGYYSSNELVTTIDRIRTALGDAAAVCLDEIVSAMRRYENHILPSFASGTSGSAAPCFLEYDSSDGKYKITLTDINGVLSYFKIDPSQLPQGLEVVFDYGNNAMAIICDDKSILERGTVSIQLISLFEGGDASVYFHPLYQDLVIPDNSYTIMISAYIKPLISEPKPTPKKPCPCYAQATKCRKTIKGKKRWVDNDNIGNTRPPTVEILLLRDGEVYQNIIIDSSDDEAFIFCCVPIWKNSQLKYNYQIDEAAVPYKYIKTIEGYNVINTLVP